MVFVNMAITFAGAKFLIHFVEEATLASNANIGGPTTAAAMAISKGLRRFVAPTIPVGTLGYIIGTYVGIFIGQLLIIKKATNLLSSELVAFICFLSK